MFRSLRFQRRLAPVAVTALLVLSSPAAAWAGRSAKSWNDRLQATVTQLREGKWEEGKANAEAGLEDLGRFHPARKGDQDVPCDYRLTVAFTLRR